MCRSEDLICCKANPCERHSRCERHSGVCLLLWRTAQRSVPATMRTAQRKVPATMRASRQTELQREFPLHVVCSWLGNSPRIAQQSYLLVTEDDFAKAAGVAKVMVEG